MVTATRQSQQLEAGAITAGHLGLVAGAPPQPHIRKTASPLSRGKTFPVAP